MPDKVKTRGSESYTGRHNWGAGQPEKPHGASISTYREAALERVDRYNDLISDICSSFSFPIKSSGACTKEEASSLRKLWDRNSSIKGDESKITDYLRATITVPHGAKGVENLTKLITALTKHPDTLAFKDQFWTPDEGTGYRSFKAIMNVDGHAAELKVEYEGLDTAYQFTESLRNFERLLKKAEEELPGRCVARQEDSGKRITRFTTNAETTIAQIRSLRKQCHDTYAHACGLDDMLSPDLQEKHTPCLFKDFVRSVQTAVNTPFGRGLVSIASKLEGAPRPAGI